MRGSYKLLFVILLFVVFSISAQENKTVDSLQNILKTHLKDTSGANALNSLSEYYAYRNQDSTGLYAKRALQLSKDIGYVSGRMKATDNLAGYYYNKSENDSAKKYYNRSLNFARQIASIEGQAAAYRGLAIVEYANGDLIRAQERNDTLIAFSIRFKDSVGLGTAYDFSGNIYMLQGRFEKALQQTQKGLRILEKVDKPLSLADAYSHLGTIEYRLNHLDEAIDYKKKALNVYQEQGDIFYASDALNDIGVIYLKANDTIQAASYYQQALESAKTSGARRLEITTSQNIAKILIEKGDYQKAKEYLDNAIELSISTRENRRKAKAQIILMKYYVKTNQFQKVLSLSDELLSYSRKNKDRSIEANTLDYRSQALDQLGNHEEALEEFRAAVAIKDSVFNKEQTEKTEQMRAVFDLERKEQELAIQEKDIKVLEQKAAVTTLQKGLLGASLIAVLSFLGVLWIRFRESKKRATLELEKLDAEIEYKQKELTTHALHLAKKNEILVDLKEKIEQMEGGCETRDIINTINFDLKDEASWEHFTQYFEKVHKDFAKHVQQRLPNVTPNELRFMALIRMNLSSKEIANILNITSDGVKKARQRLRKKMELTPEDSLEAEIINL